MTHNEFTLAHGDEWDALDGEPLEALDERRD
jgi:hypothetical protein